MTPQALRERLAGGDELAKRDPLIRFRAYEPPA